MYEFPFRVAVVKAYSYIQSFRELSRIFQVAPSTISRWKRCIFPKQSSRPPKMDSCLISFIRSTLLHHPFTTCLQLTQIIRNVFEVSVSRQLVANAIRTSGMTRKKTRQIPEVAEQDAVKQKNKIVFFKDTYQKHHSDSKIIVAIDETGFDDTSLPFMGYAPRGSRLVIHHSRRSWSRSSTIAAISSSGDHRFETYGNPVNGTRFSAFLESLPYPRGKTIILMDNIAFHKSAAVKNTAHEKGYEIIYTPPYSPWFNPIKNVL